MSITVKNDNVSNRKNAAPTFQDNVNEVKDDMREVANRASHKVRGLIGSAGDEIFDAKNKLTTQIRTNPIQSSLITLGVGYLLGLLFRR